MRNVRRSTVQIGSKAFQKSREDCTFRLAISLQ
jgi:hypothetical protein